MRELFDWQITNFIPSNGISSGDAGITYNRRYAYDYPINRVFINLIRWGENSIIPNARIS